MDRLINAVPHSHCHACGARHAETGWPRTCSVCGTVHYKNPLTVGVTLVPVAGFPEPRVLIIQRGIEPRKGQWALPGGFAEIGESYESTCQRELREETGLALPVTDFRLLHSEPTPGGEVLVFCVGPQITQAQVATIEPNDEVMAALAVPLDHTDLAFPLHRGALMRYAQHVKEA